MSELLKKIFGQLVDTDNNDLSQLPFGITIEFTKELSSDNPGGWIGSAPVKAAGQFELFTAYDMPVVEVINYRIFKDAQQITEGEAIVTDYEVSIEIEDAVYQELLLQFGSEDNANENKLAGNVTNLNGKPVDGTIEVYKVALTGNTSLGTTTTDSNGYYEFPFAIDDSKAMQVKFSRTGIDPVTSDIIYDASGLVTVDLTVPIENIGEGIVSEYELLYDSVSSAAAPSAVEDVPLSSSAFLAGLSGENELLVKILLLAHSFDQQVTATVMAYYGIMRVTTQTSLEVLINMQAEDLINALKLAVNLNIVAEINDAHIQNYVTQIKNGAKALILNTNGLPIEESKGYKILSAAIQGATLAAFLDYYYNNDSADANFWDTITIMQATGMSADDIEKIKSATCYAFITGNNPAMVSSLLTYTLENIVLLSLLQWKNLISGIVNSSDFVYPDFIEGNTAQEKLDNYATSLKNNFTGTFPSLTVKQSIVTDTATSFPLLKLNLNQLTTSKPEFDILRTPSATLSSYGYSYITDNFIKEVATVQRLSVVSSSFPAIIAMKAQGVSSAKEIASKYSGDSFVTQFSTAFGGSAAASVAYTNAVAATMYSQAIATGLYTTLNLAIPAIYTTNAGNTDPDWRTLFGSIDFCTCDDCLSVFSPAAYLVDSLELLRKSSTNSDAYEELKDRRPDLWEIGLTCKNTNTSLPYIDLVNEILEDMVKATLLPSSPNPYPYSITAYNTGSDEKTLNAIPEHVDTATVYQTLINAKYPWTAPYNYFNAQAQEFLNLINVLPYKLPQAFNTSTTAATLDDINVACAYLGIIKGAASVGDYYIITDNGSSNLRTYYGVPPTGTSPAPTIVNPANRTQLINVPNSGGSTLIDSTTYVGGGSTPFMKRADILMQQSGLSLTEIFELVDCYYINPITGTTTTGGVTTVVRPLKIVPDLDNPCDVSKITIDGLTEIHLGGMHRFVRLQRKTGWSKYELDQVLKMMGINSTASVIPVFTEAHLIKVAQLKRITEILDCSVTDILPFWGDFSYLPYSDYNSGKPLRIKTQYEQIFRNQSVIPNYDQIPGYPFDADMTVWKNATVSGTQDKMKYMLAALQLSEKDFDVLLKLYIPFNIFELGSNDEFVFNYTNTLKLYREIKLCRSLNLGVTEWSLIRGWVSALVNPFDNAVNFSKLITFVEKVAVLRNSGLTPDNIYYIFNDAFVSDADKNAKETDLKARYDALKAKLNALNDDVFTLDGTNTLVVNPKALLTKMALIMDVDDADFMVNTVANKIKADGSTVVTAYTNPEKAKFRSLLPSELTEAQKNAYVLQFVGNLTTTPDMGSITDTKERLELLNNIFNHAILKAQIQSYCSTTYKVNLETTEKLLAVFITAGIQSGYEILSDDAFITSATDTYLEQVLQVLDRFNKAALLINAAKLSAADLDFLISAQTSLNIPDIADLPAGSLWDVASDPDPVPMVNKWINMLEWFDVRKKMTPSPTGLFTVLKATLEASPSNVKKDWFDAFKMALQVEEADLTVLVGDASNVNQTGELDLNFNSTPYLVPANYKRLLACFDLQAELETSMASCAVVADAIRYDVAYPARYAVNQEAANSVLQVVKSRFGNEEWLEQVKPVNDRLRTARRDAMVTYLLAKAPAAYRAKWITEKDIFETLLIDTEMMPIVKTSRIKQAISSVQLFVDRCVLQNEGSISLPAETIRQWNLWRKWYRIWEANRRIFIYPENWIEPELRDDKSPFFVELEKFIKQNDITADTMADAYRTYLERLDEVSHLEIIAYYTEPIKDGVAKVIDNVVHVWGRTKSNPHIYFYRKRVMNVWTAWEKMDTQVDGNNFVGVKWRGKLRLYWLNLTEKSVEKPMKIKTNEESTPAKKYLKIELCWTEMKDGKWLPKKMGKEWHETAPYGAENSGDMCYHIVHGTPQSGDIASFSINTFNDSFEYLKKSLVPYCHINGDSDLEIVVLGRRKVAYQQGLNDMSGASTLRTQFQQQSNFIKDAYFPNDNYEQLFNKVWYGYSGPIPGGTMTSSAFANDSNFEKAANLTDPYYFSNFKYLPYFKGKFTVKSNKILTSAESVNTVYDTIVNNLPFIPEESQYRYNKLLSDGYTHTDGSKLLKKAPAFSGAPDPSKNVVLSSLLPQGSSGNGSMFNRFFYQDYRNAFFVENTTTPLTYATKVQVHGDNTISDPIGSSGLLKEISFESAKGVSFQAEKVNGKVMLKTAAKASKTSNSIADTFSDSASEYAVALNGSYRFYPFNYYRVEDIAERLDQYGIDGIFDWSFIQEMASDHEISFSTVYQPTSSVMHYYPASYSDAAHDVYPKTKLDFSSDHPFAIYNWELFFHIPLLIANKLMQDQKFDEAIKWYHFVFNPTNPKDPGTAPAHHGTGAERFWQFFPFYKESLNPPFAIGALMQDQNALTIAVDKWAKDPFKPHLVARTRTSAYMKTVLMKYLDNLINWGDQLFRRDTMESINEATLLYILAAQILGKSPVKVPKMVNTGDKKYVDLIASGTMNAFSNAQVAIETILAPTGVSQLVSASGSAPAGSSATATPFPDWYFCIPPNDKLLSYWSVVADRLFKIHNSQNIDGVERQLALFEPPIDPALLVRAAAAGVSLADAFNDLFAPMPQYRFSILQQKASEMVQEVKGLGSSLLSAIEKKDAEHIALLRSSQEINVMDRMREIKQYQLQEAQTQIAALQDQQSMASTRLDYYDGLIATGLNTQEQAQLDSIQKSLPLRISEASMRTLGSGLFSYPEIKIGSGFTIGATAGGNNLGSVASAAAAAIGMEATINDIKGSMAGIKGSYARRQEDWKQQSKLANLELKQIEKQLVAAEIRATITASEIGLQELQFNNTMDLDAAMHDKYSNEELYDWMIGEISLTYFQCYKLAFDLAKRAEKCYNFELGTTASYIQFGYWDSLKKGLMAGEGLSYDLKRMDASYLDVNKRQHEMTKHVSLAMLDPQELINLKSGKAAHITIPEWLFDMDYPGHYFRRIKSVSISIPCVAGPYSTVSAKLTLNSSRYRKNTLLNSSSSDPYKETGSDNDTRFSYLSGGGQSIATSTAQNDAGMFEMNFRDERYLPFEGAGAVSSWTLELPAPYASFDKNSINDVIIHVYYTAKYDGGLTNAANEHLDKVITAASTDALLPRIFSLKHEFSKEWYKGFENPVTIGGADHNGIRIDMSLSKALYPEFCKERIVTIPDSDSTTVFVQFKEKQTGSYSLIFSDDSGSSTYSLSYLDAGNKIIAKASVTLSDDFVVPASTSAANIHITVYKAGSSMLVPESCIEDIFMVTNYTLSDNG